MVIIIKALTALMLLTMLLSAEEIDSNTQSPVQTTSTSEETLYWIGFGVGNHISGSININHARMFSRLNYSRFSGNRSDNTGDRYYSQSVSLSGGVGLSYKSLKWGATAGPSYFWGEFEKFQEISEFESYRSYEKLSTLGLYIGTYILYSPFSKFGMGIDGSIHINKEDVNGGLLATVNIGKLGEPTVSRCSLPSCYKRERVGRVLIITGSSLMGASAVVTLITVANDRIDDFIIGGVSLGGVTGLGTCTSGIILLSAARNRIDKLSREVILVPRYDGIDLVVEF